MPLRIQRRRTKGWRMPPNAVYVGRPTKWGNRFVVGKTIAEATGDHCLYIIGKAQDAVDEFRYELTEPTIKVNWAAEILSHLHEIRGLDLACWCPLDQPCHADVLLRLANN